MRSVAGSPQVFIHLPKTAGTFVRHVLERLYRSVGTAYPSEPFTPLMEKSENEMLAIRRAEVFIGHEDYYTVTKFLGEVPTYTMLRNPVDRVISYYNHLMSYNPVFVDRKLSLERFLARAEDSEVDNLQVRYLCGDPMRKAPDSRSLESAMKLVEKGAIKVGIQELMDLSFRSLPLFRGASPKNFPKKNESTFGFTRDSFSQSEILKIRSTQALDFQLYEFCLSLLKRTSQDGRALS